MLKTLYNSKDVCDDRAKNAVNMANEANEMKELTVMGKYFGTDGFRGEANEVLTVEHAFKVGRFLGWYYGQDHKAKVVIGKDTRRSSYMFEYEIGRAHV